MTSFQITERVTDAEVYRPEEARVGVAPNEAPPLVVVEFSGQGVTHRYAMDATMAIEVVDALVSAVEAIRPDLRGRADA